MSQAVSPYLQPYGTDELTAMEGFQHGEQASGWAMDLLYFAKCEGLAGCFLTSPWIQTSIAHPNCVLRQNLHYAENCCFLANQPKPSMPRPMSKRDDGSGTVVMLEILK